MIHGWELASTLISADCWSNSLLLLHYLQTHRVISAFDGLILGLVNQTFPLVVAKNFHQFVGALTIKNAHLKDFPYHLFKWLKVLKQITLNSSSKLGLPAGLEFKQGLITS